MYIHNDSNAAISSCRLRVDGNIILIFNFFKHSEVKSMKVTETRLKEIIKEEMEIYQQDMDFSDDEGSMAKRQLEHLAKYASELASMLDDNTQLEGWVQAKITLAQDYISKVKHYLEDELGLSSGGCGGDAEIVPTTDSFEISDSDMYSLTEE